MPSHDTCVLPELHLVYLLTQQGAFNIWVHDSNRRFEIGFLIPFWLCLLWVGYLIGDRKGIPWPGFWLAFWLGPIGCIIALLIDPRAQCPACGKRLAGQVLICPHCQTRFVWKGNKAEFYLPGDAMPEQHKEPDVVAKPPRRSAPTMDAQPSCPRCDTHLSRTVELGAEVNSCAKCGWSAKV